MRKILYALVALFLTTAAIGQNSRLVQGLVRTADGTPLAGVIVKSVDGSVETMTASDGKFEIMVSPYARELITSFEGYLTTRVEVDGSYLVVNMKVDKNYALRKAQEKEAAANAAKQEALAKAKAEEQARIAAEKEALAKAKAEEDARIAAEKQALAKAKAEEEARIAAEKQAAAKAKAEEDARIAAEKQAAAKAKAEEEARIVAEKQAAAKAKAEELARIKAEKQAVAKVAREKRQAEIRKQSKGFGSMVDVSYIDKSMAKFSNLGLSYTAGYRFNNLVFLGAGVGAKFNFDSESSVLKIADSNYSEHLAPSVVSFPVFAYFKANFINRRFSPFFAMAAGAQLSSKQTLHLELCDVKYPTNNIFVNPQLGVNLRTTTLTALSLSVGLQCMTAPLCVEYTAYNATIRSGYLFGLDFHLGFTF